MWAVGIHATARRLFVGTQQDAEAYLATLPGLETGKYYIEPMTPEEPDE